MLDKLSNNLGLKIVALILSLILWMIVSAQRREQVTEQAFRLPLQFTGIPEGLIVTSADVPEYITVRLRGPESRIQTFSARNRSVQVDLSQATAGEVDQAISDAQIDIRDPLEIVSIDPPRVTLELERRDQKIVPVRPFTVGTLPAGYELGEVSVNPAQALISGPRSAIQETTEVATERIILSERRSSFTLQRISIVTDDPLIRVVEPQMVQVTIVVLEIPDQLPIDQSIEDIAATGD